MTSVVTEIQIVSNIQNASQPVEVKQTFVFAGGADTSGGITLNTADARYLKKPSGGNPGDVLTKGSTADTWVAPSISYASDNW